MEVVSFTLIAADTSDVITSHDPLRDGDSLNLDALGNISIRANVDPCSIGSVLWTISQANSIAPIVTHTTDNEFPYSIKGDSGQPVCKYEAWRPTPGVYTITATPYSGRDASGSAGVPLTITITITQDGVTPQGTDGWTSFTESGDTVKIYVSQSAGNDANAGTSGSPYKTLAKAMSVLRTDMPDWIYLKRGDTWTENFDGWTKSGKSEAEPKLISYYGASGNPPKLDSQGGFHLNGLSEVRHIAIVGLHFYCSAKDPGSGSYDVIVAQKFISFIRINQPMNGFLIESCWLEFGDFELIAPVQNFRFRRNACRGNYVRNGSGAGAGNKAFNGYISNGGYSFILEENTFDYGGWNPDIAGAGRAVLTHNLYCDSDSGPSLIRRNIFCRGGDAGCLQRAGGTQDDNLFVGCSGVGLIASAPSRFINNVCLSGADLDGSNPRGLGPEARICPSLLFDGNIIANKTGGIGTGTSMLIDYRDTSGFHTGDPPVALPVDPQITITNNIAYQWHGSFRVKVYDGTVTMTGNVFSDTGTAAAVSLDYSTATLIFTGNKWHNTASSGQRMKVNGTLVSFATWQARTGDTSIFVDQGFLHPSRNVESYDADVLGGAGTLDAFMTLAKAQWKENWDDRYHAPAVNAYVRYGFTPV